MVGYLDRLGVSDLYVSPILQAQAGSSHGYDVVDHGRVSDDLGGPEGFDWLAGVLAGRGMGLTVDIVPNHMAIGGPANRWWWDVLENGPSSPYAPYFDIDWPGDSSRQEPTVLVPVLGERYGDALDAGQVRLRRDGGTFSVNYFDHTMPLSPRTADGLLERAARATGSAELAELAGGFASLPHAAITDAAAVAIRHEDKERLAGRLGALLTVDRELAAAVDSEVEAVNRDPDEMDALLRRQNYRLAYWRTAREELDYRRFFNIETLVGLRVEDDRVFADTHATTARLVRSGAVGGLRVDHVDGLRDPEGYLQRLRRLAPGAYVAVEKILEGGERLPAEWPVEGTTGYDFLARVSDVMIDPDGEEPLTACYTALTGEEASFSEVAIRAKRQIMEEELAPEVDRLTRLLHRICDGHRRQRDRTRGEVGAALRAVLAAFPVYRTYGQPDRALRPEDAAVISRAVGAAHQLAPEVEADLIGFVGELLRLEHPGGDETMFALTFPQVSAPVMAKGVEDTAFYRYNRLVSLNEVGGDPGRFGRPLADFHAAMQDSAAHHPLGMLTLATHDTKRSPDVRARISLLSELPAAWEEAVTRWMGRANALSGDKGPDAGIRYLLFQTLVGAWPIEVDRLVAYMAKAAKEAKVHTSWADPDEDYDDRLRRFVEATATDPGFVSDLEGFIAEHRIASAGRASSLSQTALLLTCPGVPDVYQGTETWDNSLVDPDNRRPVDFDGLTARLDAVTERPGHALAVDEGAASADDVKLWLTTRLLRHRRARPDLYTGGYEPIPVAGRRADHLVAFTRGRLVVLVARHLARLRGDWSDTTVQLPQGSWRPVIGGPGDAAGGAHRVADLLGRGPVAVFEG